MIGRWLRVDCDVWSEGTLACLHAVLSRIDSVADAHCGIRLFAICVNLFLIEVYLDFVLAGSCLIAAESRHLDRVIVRLAFSLLVDRYRYAFHDQCLSRRFRLVFFLNDSLILALFECDDKLCGLLLFTVNTLYA